MYHEPAWEGLRVTMVALDRVKIEYQGLANSFADQAVNVFGDGAGVWTFGGEAVVGHELPPCCFRVNDRYPSDGSNP